MEMVVVFRPAEIIQGFRLVFQGLGHGVEEQVLVDRPVGPPSALAPLSEINMMSVFSHSRSISGNRTGGRNDSPYERGIPEHLHHAGIDLLLLGRTLVLPTLGTGWDEVIRRGEEGLCPA